MSPEAFTPTPKGSFNWALVAAASSPEYPHPRLRAPATVEIWPVEDETLRITQFPVSAMKMFPEPSTATPKDWLSWALVAAPPSPEYPQLAVPATVEIMPVEVEILRIAQLVVSAMMTFPELSTATPLGNPSLALVAKPPPPEYPQCKSPVMSGSVPATVEIMPVEAETIRIKQLLVSAMKMFPDLSRATPEGLFSVALVAGPPSPL